MPFPYFFSRNLLYQYTPRTYLFRQTQVICYKPPGNLVVKRQAQMLEDLFVITMTLITKHLS